jgi:hypothetical protein
LRWIWTFRFPRDDQGLVRSQLVLGLSLFLRWPISVSRFSFLPSREFVASRFACCTRFSSRSLFSCPAPRGTGIPGLSPRFALPGCRVKPHFFFFWPDFSFALICVLTWSSIFSAARSCSSAPADSRAKRASVAVPTFRPPILWRERAARFDFCQTIFLLRFWPPSLVHCSSLSLACWTSPHQQSVRITRLRVDLSGVKSKPSPFDLGSSLRSSFSS